MSLLARAFSDNNLRRAWDKVRSKNASPGVDGVTVFGFGRNLDRNLSRLRRQILSGHYQPQPVLRCHIPKADGDFRRIGIPTVVERIAQRALLDTLIPIIDPQLSPSSYAYRPNRSVRQAIVEIERLRDEGKRWCARTDIDLCFESIPHEPLLARLYDIVPDGAVVELIHRWMSAGVVDGPDYAKAKIGLQQGDVLSPVLCNVYLDSLDRTLLTKGHALVRYADDMLLLCPNKDDAFSARADTYKALASLSLSPNPEKTEVTSFLSGFRYLGTIFVGRMTLPAVKIERENGPPVYTSGYESSSPRLSVEQDRDGGIVVKVAGGPLTERQVARMVAREVALDRRGTGTSVGRAIVEAWRERQNEKRRKDHTDWDDHGTWAYLG